MDDVDWDGGTVRTCSGCRSYALISTRPNDKYPSGRSYWREVVDGEYTRNLGNGPTPRAALTGARSHGDESCKCICHFVLPTDPTPDDYRREIQRLTLELSIARRAVLGGLEKVENLRARTKSTRAAVIEALDFYREDWDKMRRNRVR